MLAEGDPKKIEILKENTYSLFKECLSDTGHLANEFSKDSSELSRYEKSNLAYAGSESRIKQLKHLVDQLRDEYDPENYVSKILEILNQAREDIDDDIYEDMVNYVRLGRSKK